MMTTSPHLSSAFLLLTHTHTLCDVGGAGWMEPHLQCKHVLFTSMPTGKVAHGEMSQQQHRGAERASSSHPQTEQQERSEETKRSMDGLLIACLLLLAKNMNF